MPKKSPINKGYLIHNRSLFWIVKSIDFLTSFFLTKKNISVPEDPRSFLISNLAHLGDVLIAKSIIKAIKSKYPHSEIGIVVGSWSKNIVEGDLLINDIYYVDHWRLDRSKSSFSVKFIRYLRTRSRAVTQIKRKSYQVAIDSYYFFPNSIFMFWQCDVPVRIGYNSAGFGNFLTHSLDWRPNENHVIDYHKRLLQILGFDERDLDQTEPYMDVAHKDESNIPINCFVFHIGSSSKVREWSVENWKRLIELCKPLGFKVVFTGVGEREAQLVSEITRNSDALDLCNKLTWQEYVSLIDSCRLLVGVESMAGHLAAAMKKPYIVIKTGTTNQQWEPYGKSGRVLIADVECSPCYVPTGCAEMSCISRITPEVVFSNITNILGC